MKLLSILAILVTIGCDSCIGLKFAPFYDTFLKNRTSITDIAAATGQKHYHLAFALGSGFEGCKPTWGGEFDINDPEILGPIKALMQNGGEMIVATGGALGPYLEHACSTVETLVAAYKQVLDAVGTHHLDIDVETSINIDLMNKALAVLQTERPEVTVSFTLMVTGEDYGVTPSLGYDLLKNARDQGVRVDIVNAMAMEYPKISEDFGDSIIQVGVATLLQMREIWPEKNSQELKSMLGITPMIGRNFNGNILEVAQIRKVAEWAVINQIGLIAFWSMERDNGRCAGAGAPSPYCSGITQEAYEFTKTVRGIIP